MTQSFALSDLAMLDGPCNVCGEDDQIMRIGCNAVCLFCKAEYRFGITIETQPFDEVLQEFGLT
jgi:hypothetical protein